MTIQNYKLTNFNIKYIISLIHRIYVIFLKKTRKYLASTKTKAHVQGSNKKPWKQKGTGRARAGSIRSPLWKGGGVIFGPKPHTIIKKINKKEYELGVFFIFLLKSNFQKLYYINNFNNLTNSNTLVLLKLLNKILINKNIKILLIDLSFPKKILLKFKNFKNITLINYNDLKFSTLINNHYFFISNALKMDLLLFNLFNYA
jgi:large subunit ribosomal protein L4